MALRARVKGVLPRFGSCALELRENAHPSSAASTSSDTGPTSRIGKNGRAGTGPIAQSDRHAIIWADIYCLGLGVRSAPVSAQPQRDGLLKRQDHITLLAQDRDRAPIERHLRISSTCHPRHPNGRTRLTFIHHVFWQVRRDGHYCTYFFGHIAGQKE